MALNSLFCADVSLSNYSLAHSLTLKYQNKWSQNSWPIVRKPALPWQPVCSPTVGCGP